MLINPIRPPFELEEILSEAAPNDPKIEKWIEDNKEAFEKEYGKEKAKEVLYAKAWKMYNANKKSKETKKEDVAFGVHFNVLAEAMSLDAKTKEEADAQLKRHRVKWDKADNQNVDGNEVVIYMRNGTEIAIFNSEEAEVVVL